MKKNSFSQLAAVFTAGILTVSTVGCGSTKSEDAVPVQSAAVLAGITDVMQTDQYAGVVTSGKETQIMRQSDRKIAEVKVKAGDAVTKGQVLFTYDAEQAQNDLDKQRLELEQLQNTLTTKTEEKAQLEKDKAKAKAEEQLDYTLKIQEADTDISETNYNIGLKQKEIEKSETLLSDLDVRAPFDGRIESIASDDTGGYSYSGSGGTSDSGSEYMKLVQTDVVRVKGLLNEANMGMIGVDMPMIIRSRTDRSKTWSGTVSSMDTQGADTSDSDNSGMYYDGGSGNEMTTSSNYAFYVTMEEPEGLLIGQHVYIEYDFGQTEQTGSDLRLPSGFILDADSNAYVWAEDGSGRLEKKNVTLGAYSEEDDTYPILEGLDAEDYIAFPDDSYEEGMLCVESSMLSDDTEVTDMEDLTGWSDAEYAEGESE